MKNKTKRICDAFAQIAFTLFAIYMIWQISRKDLGTAILVTCACIFALYLHNKAKGQGVKYNDATKESRNQNDLLK